MPSGTIRVVTGYAPGGSSDLIARLIAGRLSETTRRSFIVDNRPGAAGSIGANVVAHAAPDGYTLLLASSLAISPHLQKGGALDPQKDLVPVVPVVQIEFALVVHPGVQATNLSEFVTLVKKDPGKYSYASAGVGSIHHLSMEWFKRLAGIDLIHIPYKGSGQILPDVITGLVNVTYIGLAQTTSFVKAGKLRVLAIGGPQRIAVAPDLVPIAETYPGYNGTTSWDLLAPRGTPREIVQKLNVEVNRILRDPAVAEQLTSRGLFPLGGTSEEFSIRARSDYERWGKLIAEIGVKAE